MITNCKNCELPSRCGFSAKPNYDHNALADLLKERGQLKAHFTEIEAALVTKNHEAHDLEIENRQLKAENERLSKITCVTMGVGNGSGSLFVHGDYESIKADQAAVIERDALRKQVDEARELLRIAASGASCNSVHHGKKDQHAYDEQCPVLHRIDAWLEANKV